MKNKIFAIGDIHGKVGKLKRLINRLPLSENDLLVFLGDYVDRGENSFEVIEYLIELRDKRKCVFIKGNHEVMLKNFLSGKETYLYLYNGGLATIRSYEKNGYDIHGNKDIPKSHNEFFKTLKPYYKTDNYIFVHAGMLPGIPMIFQTNNDLMWSRDFYYRYAIDYKGPKVVVFAHTPEKDVMNKEFAICIDTGAYRDDMGKLTCVELPDRKFWQEG
jgi:serine/threonine protein phosphatase 1